MTSIRQLAEEWRAAQHVLKVIGGREAAAAAEAARQALAEAVKRRRGATRAPASA